MCQYIFDKQEDNSHIPQAEKICEDWRLAVMEAYETLPFEEVGRVIQEIDNRFNDFLDWARFQEEDCRKAAS
jgi:ATP-dependent RNA circularization protein (DNA/RNA ligase family)